MPADHVTSADRTPRRWLLLTAVLTATVLAFTARDQIFDTNFYVLWEATALLNGDHPYRDFFEWGVPLQAAISAAMQWLVGYRLIGEFAIHWLAIVAGGVIAFDLGYRLSRSLIASIVGLIAALAMLAVTPTFHYPKLLLYPLAIRLTWWYMDHPSVRRGLALGAVIACAFLFRHDHGVYIGLLVALGMLVTRLLVPGRRSAQGLVREAAAGLAMVIALLAPWAVIVHANEGLPEYVRYRQELFAEFSAGFRSPLDALPNLNPWVTLAAENSPVEPGVITFEWVDPDNDQRRVEMERRLDLRPTGLPVNGRWSYQVRNRRDPALLDLMGLVENSEHIDWNLLQRLGWRLPARDNALLWLLQVSQLVPVLLLGSSAAVAAGHWRRGEPLPIGVWRMVLAGVFLIVVEVNLFREASYVVIVAPLTAAVSTVFLAWPLRHRWPVRSPLLIAWLTVRTLAAFGTLAATALAIYAYTYGAPIYAPLKLAERVVGAFPPLLASPPIDGLVTHAAASAATEVPLNGSILTRYMYDCTSPADRLLITGNTPFQVGYYAERSIAGGQLFWHHRWRTDAEGQRQQLALLQRQSVPFAFSSADPVFEDLAAYPLVLAYMQQHYVEVPGTERLLLVDRRRTPSGTYGALGLPCFR